MTWETLFEKFKNKNDVSSRKMFGADGLFINGNCFVALMDDGLLFRLDAKGQEIAIRIDGSEYFDPMKKGTPMKSWIVVPLDSVDRKTELVFEEAFRYVSGMPAKVKKPKTKKKK